MPGRKLCQRGDCSRLVLSESLCMLGLALVSRAVGGGALVRAAGRSAAAVFCEAEQASAGLSLLTSRALTSATTRTLARASSRLVQIRNMAESLAVGPAMRPDHCRL